MGVIKQQTIKGTLYSYIGIGIGFISMIIIQPHALTPDEVGLIGILLSFSLLFSQFSVLGFGGTVRYFPYFRSEEKKHHGYLFLSCIVALVGTVIFVGAIYLFKDQIIGRNQKNAHLFEKYYWYLVPLIIFTVYFNVFDQYARMMYNAISGKILREFTKRIFILITLILIYLKWVSFETFMVLWLIANAVPTLLLLIRLVRDKHFFLNPDFSLLNKEMRTNLITISVWGLMVGSSPLIFESIDDYMLNNKFGLAAAGIYTITFYVAAVISMPARSLYSIATTVIAEAWKTNDMKTIKSVYEKSCINQLVTTLFLFIIIWASIDDLFTYLPEKYQLGKYVVLFIALGNLIDSATGINGVILSTSKYYRYDGTFYVLLIPVTVGFNLLLIPYYGITGPAIATALTLLIFNVFRYFFILKTCKIQPFTISSPIALAIGIAVYFASKFIIPQMGNHIVDIILRSAFITIIYGGAVYFLKLSDDINIVVDNFVSKLKRA
ncbi:polysaccharide biosynthesis protein [Mucilaginibacter sp.]